MSILEQIHKILRSEYPSISPTMAQAVIRFVSGGRTHETFEQFSARMTKNMDFDSEKEKNDFIYTNVLDLSRNVCQTQEMLGLLKEALSKSIKTVKQKKTDRKKAYSSSRSTIGVLTTENYSPAMFSASNKKRRLGEPQNLTTGKERHSRPERSSKI
ncbi:MAG: hypothetical protein NXI01_10180 [Gammaproteobacteria bacterium]|nr:hypothetical protein [Gammaproteobacteria bacterium]